jgi:hypothetical protein
LDHPADPRRVNLGPGTNSDLWSRQAATSKQIAIACSFGSISLSIEIAALHGLRLPSLTSVLSPVNSHSKSQQSFLRFQTLYSGHALLS